MRAAGHSRSSRSPARSQLSDERAPDGNLFRRGERPPGAELFERLAEREDLVVERIVSAGHATEPGRWLVGERDEWVALVEGEAELSFADGSRLPLGPGDHVLISAGLPHRVEWTRQDPPCVWLAVHAIGLAPPDRDHG